MRARIPRDPRLLLLAVPFIGLLLLMSSSHGASPVPLAARRTVIPVAPTTGGEKDKVGAPGYQPPREATTNDGGDMVASGAGDGGGEAPARRRPTDYSRRPTVSVESATEVNPNAVTTTAPAGVTTTLPAGVTTTTQAGGSTTVPATTTTTPVTTTTVGPGPMVGEASSPIVMILVAVGAAAIIANGLVLFRRRRASTDST